ncbi:histidine kinase-like ATPase [Paraphysoderma sedebokerense]|nr:histidine kinase-like ATPase [Paraphysoderma sedebokerense]
MDAFSIDEDVKVAYYIQEGTPQSVMGDETRLRQIITNLVSNAIKFTSKGYVLLFVSSEKAADAEYDINFRIIDTGCGIASDKVDKIFQRFEQEDDSITRKFGGTGLGLSICQSMFTMSISYCVSSF